VAGKKSRDKKETYANFGIWLVNRPLRAFVTGSVFLAILSLIKPFAFFSIPVNWMTAGLTLLVADFIYYWNHRLSHQIRLLWAYHSVHHSSGEFNLSTAIRLPWLGNAADALFYIPAVLLGFNPLMLAISKAIVLLYQYWIHTESVGKLRVFDAVFNSPSNHRVHHGSNQQYLDKNHGGILIIWDKLFNTYQPEVEPVIYGLTTPLTTRNPFTINFIEPLNIASDVLSAPGIRNKLMFAFGPPGWKPDQSNERLLSKDSSIH
jgi:sterol desaturase/sphingolipid hydroxylase (fatty acid hydroxylase superfamily)